MPLRLSFETGTLAGIHIVTSAPVIRLGRDPQTNDILLTNPKVSRKHAVIERSVRGGYSLEVLGTGPAALGSTAIRSPAIAGRLDVLAVDRRSPAFGGVDLSVEAGQADRGVGSVGRPRARLSTARCGSAAADCDSCSRSRGARAP
jgi:hypothetical protein